jgi:hypothetical protein
MPAAHHDAIIIMMRTTLNLPDDVYEAAKSLAQYEDISLGDALARLVRRAFQPAIIDTSKDFPVFVVPPDAKLITLERTLELEDEW